MNASGGGAPDSNPYDCDLLVQAVTATGLAPVLDDESKRFTVFAPNDRAFMRLVADLTATPPASEQAALETAAPSLQDPRLVLWAINIQATNGVIHTIDRVLVPAAG